MLDMEYLLKQLWITDHSPVKEQTYYFSKKFDD